ncbi:response regulator [Sneathiella chinensis]|uniref:DNA-binding response regulator n=1 Tax=Sneathiella chinensis TaxID=349750 RepID=A0ABQ5U873_9PROT|nr:response regulator transcription factor [Sneathiella chinensis]GLQ07996.1 DNA-binding response regulator [Sneathiella chinensis]
MRILLIEDDKTLGNAVYAHMAEDGHAVDWAPTLTEAYDNLGGADYDLVLLDLMLPDGKGLDLLRGLRTEGKTTPVIILTARDQITDRIDGLNTGADDYLVKPFDLSELTARIAAVSRRYGGNPNPVIRLGDVAIDLGLRSAEREGEPIHLTAKEWIVLEALLQRRGMILSKPKLEERLYNFDADFDSNTVEVHISRLRKKLGHATITTVRGLGYRIDPS